MTGTNTDQLVIIHRAFRRESYRLVDLVAAVEPGDTARARALAGRVRGYQARLRHHQHGKDELLWPPLLARLDRAADLVLRARAGHDRIAATLSEIDAALPAWQATAGPDDRDRLVASLAQHRALLASHLADEDTELLPLAGHHLPQHEWQALYRHILRHRPLSAHLSALLRDTTRAERALLLAALPRGARLAWHLIGRPLHHLSTR
jgi:hypothetical protein